MPSKRRADDAASIVCQPLTPDRWAGLERLFGPRGASSGCWCMWWRLPRSTWGRQGNDGNREAFKTLVDSGMVPGLLAYVADESVGWCAVQPRDAYPSLDRSSVLGRVDDTPVWSITCFYIARTHRRQGVAQRLLEAAVAHARAQGARLVEGYPVDPGERAVSSASAFTGLAAAFRKAGFTEVARRSPQRPIMRLATGDP